MLAKSELALNLLGIFPYLSNRLPLSRGVINMGRSRLTVQQGNVQRVLKAAKQAGLEVSRVEVEASTGNIILSVKENGNEVKKIINPLDNAPTYFSARKGRK